MERIKLSKIEKKCLLLLNRHGSESLDTIARSQVCRALRSLESKDMVNVAWMEGGDYEAVKLSHNGRSYLIENPNLRNPIDWNKVSAIAAIVAALAAIAALFIACTRLA